MSEADLRAAVENADRQPTYAAAIQVLSEAGIHRYHTDVRCHTNVYRSQDATYTVPGDAIAPDGAVPERFDPLAIRAAPSGEVDYTAFLRGLWAAGVVTYEVDLAARTLTYHGANGETEVEMLPG